MAKIYETENFRVDSHELATAMQLPDRGAGFYDDFEPLNEEDIRALQVEIGTLEHEAKHDLKEWGLDA